MTPLVTDAMLEAGMTAEAEHYLRDTTRTGFDRECCRVIIAAALSALPAAPTQGGGEAATIAALRHRIAYLEARPLCPDCMGKVPSGCCPRCHGQQAGRLEARPTPPPKEDA